MKNIELKKVLLGVLATVVLLVAADWAVGTWSEMMYYKSKFGIFHRQIYCLQESKDDILILGSSRAAHHYVPQIFEDSLGMSCYNAGSDGMCIYYHYAVLASRIHRGCAPRMVVLEVMPSDVEVSGGATFTLDAALDRLAPHYGEVPAVDSLFALNGWKESLKLKSKTYRYNSKLVQTIKCNYIPWPEDKGYEALSGVMEVVDGNTADVLDVVSDPVVEDTKVEYLHKLINICKQHNIKLAMCYSPYYGVKPSKSIAAIKDIAREENILFLDYSLDEEFQKAELFQDASHMNDTGARKYTNELLTILKY